MQGLSQRANIQTRDIPGILITEEITKVSRTLCQEPEVETNIYFLSSQTHSYDQHIGGGNDRKVELRGNC